jgi:hypothetical protein
MYRLLLLQAASTVRMTQGAQIHFLVIISLVFVAACLASPCPTSSDIYDITILSIRPGADCAAGSLDSVTAGLGETDEGLNLTSNAISVMRIDAFNKLGVSKLQFLPLDNNNMVDLEKDAFRGLAVLRTLSLKNNGLMSIHPDVFTYCPLLDTLYLNRTLLKLYILIHSRKVLC